MARLGKWMKLVLFFIYFLEKMMITMDDHLSTDSDHKQSPVSSVANREEQRFIQEARSLRSVKVS